MTNNGPLAGMRVLELAQIMAGPTCGMLLADMGADVHQGREAARRRRHAELHASRRVNGESAPFMILNRNKRGIAVEPEDCRGGLEVVKRLLADADVVTENYRQGTLEKLGLGYDVLRDAQSRASSTARSPATAAPARTPTRAAST